MQFRFSICNSVRYTVTLHSGVLKFCAHTSVCVCVRVYILQNTMPFTLLWKCIENVGVCNSIVKLFLVHWNAFTRVGIFAETTTTINKKRAVVVAVAFSSGARKRTFYSSLIYRKCTNFNRSHVRSTIWTVSNEDMRWILPTKSADKIIQRKSIQTLMQFN